MIVDFNCSSQTSYYSVQPSSRGNCCSRLTCKKCGCYKRKKDGELENLDLSTQVQDYIDQMSSDSEDEISSEYESDHNADDSPYEDLSDDDELFRILS